jgi:hypothetical protein
MLLVCFWLSDMMGIMLTFCLVLARYLFKLADAEPSAWQSKGVAAASYTVAVLG